MVTSSLRGSRVGFRRSVHALAASSACLLSSAAHAQDISWVNWASTSNAGPYVVSGQDIPSGLSVSSVFNARTTTTWSQDSTTVTDASWNFGSRDIAFWMMYEIGAYQGTMTIDFLNAGGFAPGGSLSILDLENADSNVSVTGFRWSGTSFQEVPVNWVASNFNIVPTSMAAVWNPSTRALTGAGGTLVGGISTLSVLSSDVQLDRIVLNITLPTFDGIGIGLTQTNIGAATVPAGGVGMLFGLLGATRRRSRA
jgi:hypothetical protein